MPKRIIGKAELIENIARDLQADRDIGMGHLRTVVNTVLTQLTVELHQQLAEGHTVRLPNIGTFQWALSAERKARNPRTGEPIFLPPRFRVKFSRAAALKALSLEE